MAFTLLGSDHFIITGDLFLNPVYFTTVCKNVFSQLSHCLCIKYTKTLHPPNATTSK